ncbi:MAG: thiamine pyrophosphate-binding protein [Alphaproteobacteria bacterium]|jgi:benzoylformate decarboxylase|nr:thiamine pyrophosphate-binding protein [Alphaproteobacteria bacterium]MDP6812250.1 thiamine pyrophosphate-binding protein [Alphaproteobacteria bacterium]
MRARQVFMESLLAHGVEHIFGNPGTTESPLIGSLPDYPQLSYQVALHEGIAVGAASYYAQASGRTGVANLHVAPGLGNALGMLYGAHKANSPLLVTAGQQDSRMRLREPLLGHDLVAMAAPVTKWSVQVERGEEMDLVLRRAFKVAHDPPAGPVFLSLPIDVMEQQTEQPASAAGELHRAPPADPAGIARAAELLLAAERPAIVVGDDVARARGHGELVALAEAVGAAVWFEGLRQHASFPSHHANARAALPFEAAGIRKALDGADLVLLAGGPFFEEVWFAPGSPFPDGAAVLQIEETPQRLAFNHPLAVGLVGALPATLAALTAAVGKGASADDLAAAERRNGELAALKEAEAAAHRARLEKAWDRQPMAMVRAMAELAGAMPADCIVVEESITANLDLARSFAFNAPGDYFSGRGGGIGQGLAGALGVKAACPERPVLAISGDGSAMYSIQALWTAAHHDLAIVFVILANREYRVLKHNLDTYRQRFDALSNQDYPHMDLAAPALGFVEMAAGMGVGGERIEAAEQIGPALGQAFASGKPYLLEVAIEGKR